MYRHLQGIGPKKAIELVKKFKNIETILENIDKTKYPVPDNWMYSEARRLFKEPEVTPAADIELKWEKPNEVGRYLKKNYKLTSLFLV